MEPEAAPDYFLPALLAAQKAFNLADSFALVAELTVFFLAFTADRIERDGLAAKRLFPEALVLGFFVDAIRFLADPPRIPARSLFRFSICSLIAAARLSWLLVISNRFMPPN